MASGTDQKRARKELLFKIVVFLPLVFSALFFVLFYFLADEHNPVLRTILLIYGLIFCLISFFSSWVMRTSRERDTIGTILKESEKRYQMLTENATDVIWTTDLNFKYTYMSPSVKRLRGYTPEEAMALTAEETLAPESYALAKKVFQEESEKEKSFFKDLHRSRTLEFQERCKDGSFIWTEVTMSFLRDKRGWPVSIMGATRNISDRKKIETRLKENEERLRVMLEGVQDYAIVMLDNLGYVMTWNKSAEMIKGYKEEEIVGGHFSKFYTLEDIKEDKPVSMLEIAGEQGKCEDEGWRVKKDGALFWANVVVTALRDDQRQLKGFCMVTRDMTERKKAQEALMRKSIELARIDAEKQQLELFSYTASHDLREPLQKIIGFGGLLKEATKEHPDPKLSDYVERMQNAALRMNQLIDDLLRFSKITKKEELFEAVDLNVLVKEVLADLELRIQRTKGEVVVKNLPVVKGDRSQMQQLFQNLIANALKFHRKDVPPKIVIESRALGHLFSDIFVRDNGVGFDEKYLDKIFKPFERLHNRSEFEGSGLGLAICQKIVSNHDGRITAKSAPGSGAEFIVTLPVFEAKEGMGHHDSR